MSCLRRRAVFPLLLALLQCRPAPALNGAEVSVGQAGKKTHAPSRKGQEEARIDETVLRKADRAPVSILISLSRQRIYLLVGGETAIDSPISSGRRSGWTPKGEFTILEKDPDHVSNLYGDFVDGNGHAVRSGVSRSVLPPPGTRFRGAPMRFFMRLTPEGVGLHAGVLPGYPASHGCIRLPREIAELIYGKAGISTPVTVTD
jgi:lipoprotein-anchoring transpeptidase ErfK/SrfK